MDLYEHVDYYNKPFNFQAGPLSELRLVVRDPSLSEYRTPQLKDEY